MRYRRLVSTLFALNIIGVVAGQTLTDSVKVHFRQSKTVLDTLYMSNRKAFDHIKDIVDFYQAPGSRFALTGIAVTGGASPEGTVRFNNYLSEHRAARIFDYLDNKMELPDSVDKETMLGRDWRGLRTQVMLDTVVPYRQDVLKVLDDIIGSIDNGNKDTEENLLRIKRLHRGIPYVYMYRNIFPGLRQANVQLTFTNISRNLLTLDLIDQDPIIPTVADITPALVKPRFSIDRLAKPFYMAIKTNILADALALPEIGVEFYLGKNISIVGNWMYGWWDNDAKHKYWRAYGGDLALRWWFGKAAHEKPLTGNHIGICGGVVTYDFEFGGKGHMGGRPGHNLWERCMHVAGVEYGYSLPIARRLNIDFTLAVGYMGGKVVEYVPHGHCYLWESTKQKHYVGPLKLEISLTWLIGHGNYNKKGAAK